MKSGLLRFYRASLSRFFVFRLMKAVTLFLLRQWHQIRMTFGSYGKVNKFKFVSMQNFQQSSPVVIKVYEEKHHLLIPAPQFIGHCMVKPDKVKPVELESPVLQITELMDAAVVGGTNYIIIDDQVIHPDLYEPEHNEGPAEVYGVAKVNHSNGEIKLYLSVNNKTVDKAVSFLGQCTNNYAHWLTETLPRLMVLEQYPEYDDMPILIDAWIHKNFYESIEILGRRQRKLIPVTRWEMIKVSHLIDVSPTGYEPYVAQKLFKKAPFFHINRFSSTALNMLRQTAQQVVSGDGKRKIYLSRKGSSNNIRTISNAEQIDQLLEQSGFELVDPGALTFSEQVAACKGADVIVAPVGATLANMCFASQGCHIIVFAGDFEEGNYYYYSNLANALGHKLFYLVGKMQEQDRHPMHQDYEINLDDLKNALKAVCSE